MATAPTATAPTAAARRTPEELPWQRIVQLLSAVLGLLALYAVLSAEALLNDGVGPAFDRAVLVAVEALHLSFLDDVFLFLTHTGDRYLAIPVLLSVGWLWRRGERPTAALQVFATIWAPLLAKVLKYDLVRPRQSIIVPLVEESSTSFPSGHTLTAVVAYGFIAMVLWQRDRRPLAVAAGAWGLAIAFSRVYLGAHYPTDVLASIVYGIGLLVLAHLVEVRLRAGLRRIEWRDVGPPTGTAAASPRDRVTAGAIDLVVTMTMLGPGLVALDAAGPGSSSGRLTAGVLLLVGLAALSWHGLRYVPRNSGTIGQGMRGLRIVTAPDGGRVTEQEASRRWALLVGLVLTLLLPFVLVGDLVALVTRHDGRTLRDLIAGTAVVRRVT